MLFLVSWEFVDTSEDGQRRVTDIFTHWQRPDGADFQGFFGYADNSGGCAVIDVPDHATLARVTAPFTPWLVFTTKALIPVEESVGIVNEAFAFWDSVP